MLLAAELFKLMLPLVLVKLDMPVKFKIAVSLAKGVIEIFPPLEGPNAPAELAVSVPLLITVGPVYVFVPESVNVPVPILVIPPAALVLLITPA